MFGDWAGSPANSTAGATGWRRRGPATRLGRRHELTTLFGTTRAGTPGRRNRKAADIAGPATEAVAWCSLLICRSAPPAEHRYAGIQSRRLLAGAYLGRCSVWGLYDS